jgi:hypothetical protein
MPAIFIPQGHQASSITKPPPASTPTAAIKYLQLLGISVYAKPERRVGPLFEGWEPCLRPRFASSGAAGEEWPDSAFRALQV